LTRRKENLTKSTSQKSFFKKHIFTQGEVVFGYNYVKIGEIEVEKTKNRELSKK
jgi:hypothetical protein